MQLVVFETPIAEGVQVSPVTNIEIVKLYDLVTPYPLAEIVTLFVVDASVPALTENVAEFVLAVTTTGVGTVNTDALLDTL